MAVTTATEREREGRRSLSNTENIAADTLGSFTSRRRRSQTEIYVQQAAEWGGEGRGRGRGREGDAGSGAFVRWA